MKIIGISGKAGSGKDYMGKLLRKYGYQNVALAWALKLEAVARGIGTFEEVFQTKPPRVRAWLQEYGNDMRQSDPAHWIKRLAALIDVLHFEGGVPNFVITDIRFPNEADFVLENGGKLIRMQHGDRPYPLAGTLAAEHISEVALDYVPDSMWALKLENNLSMTPDKMELALYASGVIDSRPGRQIIVARMPGIES